ncbi:beta-class carbonic anhydrase [Pectinatus sottacetonis]|uniref:beta-class carbonic anhydrase n=1 Tax=Pectinatus sottacetonis TaxID=1002795 RepID=UPI0018C4BEC9|nr:carbonic anhydrase [Pectinatus sottacetonis]
MDIIKKVMSANDKFIKNNNPIPFDKLPKWHVAIVTCMDTRLVNFLEPAMGISRGDVKMIKTAGNVVSGGLNDVIKSLMVCVYELGVKEILVVGHCHCGMEKTTSSSLSEKMKIAHITPAFIKKIIPLLKNWADNFQQPQQNVIDSVNNIKNSPYLPGNIIVHGFIIDPDTGKLELLTNNNQG